jgi:GTP cyclohydrolase I
MAEQVFLSVDEVRKFAHFAAERITQKKFTHNMIYGVPRGGIPVAFAICNAINKDFNFNTSAMIVDDPSKATVIVDDLIDSGQTMSDYNRDFPDVPFEALIDKREGEFAHKWIVFPWEGMKGLENSDTVHDNVRRLLQYIGEDATREGLQETPNRVIRAYEQWFSGYGQDPSELFKAFLDGSEKHQGDEMVILRDIPVYSHCEHHMAPFFGVAHVGYIPQGKILGLSKIARVVDCFARRLQVQERLTSQIADAFDKHLSNRGVGVIIKARHLCMESRGVQAVGVVTTTSAMRGNLLLNQATRQEFLALVQNGG